MRVTSQEASPGTELIISFRAHKSSQAAGQASGGVILSAPDGKGGFKVPASSGHIADGELHVGLGAVIG